MPQQVLEQLQSHASRWPTKPAIITVTPPCGVERTMTYSELHHSVARFALELGDTCKPGEVVIVCLPNQPECLAACLGVWAANLTAFPIHPSVSPFELRSAISRAGATLMIGDSVQLEKAAEVNVRRIDVHEHSDSASMHERTSLSIPQISGAALMLQSSGTTGRPKIVYRNASSLDAVASNVVAATKLSERDHVLAAMPLCHSYGIENGLLAPMLAGATLHLSDGFDPLPIIDHLANRGVTVFPGVPFMFQMLAERGGAFAAPHLRLTYSAGGMLPAAVARAFSDRCGSEIGQLYGSTEIGSVTFGDPNAPGFSRESVGRPMRGVNIRILDPDNLENPGLMPLRQEGLVAIASPSMLDRYVDDDHVPLIAGCFNTGDLGYIDDDGNLVITGRIKLQIDVGGLKVNPLEVEHVLAQHPAVKECVVVAAPMSETVERLKAVVTLQQGNSGAGVEELRRFARSRLASYKVPRLFEVRESLPKSPSGKILREALRCD